MTENLSQIYEEHHRTSRQAGFFILKDERGRLLQSLIGQGQQVLDIGCRDGALTQYFAQGNKVLGVDIDEHSLQKAASLGIETQLVNLNGDWRELRGRVFDVVVAGEVLEHLYYPEKVASRAAACLSAGGLFLGSVPNAFSLKNRLRYLAGSKRHTPLSDPTHITQFSARELKDMLAKHFKEVEIVGLGRYLRLARFAPSLFAFDLFFIAKK